MKLVIAGSRGIVSHDHWSKLIQLIEELAELADSYPTEVLHGGNMQSPDRFGNELAASYDCLEVVIAPDYDAARRKGIPTKAAPQIRNNQLADRGDALVGLWDGQSPGTESMMKRFKKARKPYRVWRVDNHEILRFTDAQVSLF